MSSGFCRWCDAIKTLAPTYECRLAYRSAVNHQDHYFVERFENTLSTEGRVRDIANFRLDI